jgi:hypothetical protein
MSRSWPLMAVATISLLACGGGTTNPGTQTPNEDAQTPPTTGRVDIEAWLAKGDYKNWHCEAAVHDARSPSPHGKNRICSNDKVSATASGAYPVDSAGVKELYDSTGTTIVGYAVYRKVADGTGGDSWYWYERVPLTSAAPHDANGTVADGLGSSGPPQTICVTCHQAASRDFVYTRVTP